MSRLRTYRKGGFDVVDLAWMLLTLGIGFWVFHRLGGFDLWTSVSIPGGDTERIVKTFGAVDHPFHASRAEIFRRSLVSGDVLRWISAHQGGYPVEFYPLGAPAFETFVWALTFGLLPMMAVHKIAVILIFLLPALGFLLLARSDRLTLGVGVLALVFHISARGWWWSGGYMELVDWGLVSSFLAMSSVLLFMPLAFRAVRCWSARWAVAAALVASFAVYTNVRSFLPLTAIAVGLCASLCWEPDRRESIRPKLATGSLILLLSGLLAAPLLIPVIRFNHLYYFVSYQQYASLRSYLQASIQAVSGPIFVLALIGFVAVFLMRDLVAGRFVALTLAAHVVMTILLSGLTLGPTIEQLEAPRLMPLQRALTIYLAALGTYAILALLARLVEARRVEIVNIGLLGAAIASVLLYVVLDTTPIAASDRGLYPVLVTGEPYLLEQQSAVELADERAAPGSAVLVLGSNLSWHDQFWSMQWSDRPFFFDDWLWYWQQDHYGDYDPATGHAYPDPASALDELYLSAHGIGAVVVTGRAAAAAAASPLLEPIQRGAFYSTYLVRDPTSMVTATGTETTSVSIGNQEISAAVAAPATTFEVRRNWYPRWQATVDGNSAEISKDENGYMVVTASTPGTHLEVTYAVDWMDWLGRLLLVAGLAGVAVALVKPSVFDQFLRTVGATVPAGP